MSLDETRRRRSIRLRDFDYSQAGAYFVTICTAKRQLFFDNPTIWNIANECWSALPDHFLYVQLDEWIIMPNHVHGILTLEGRRGVQLNAPTRRNLSSVPSVISPKRGTLGLVIRTYKAAATTVSRKHGHDECAWQRNYHERIIRDEAESDRIREYIRNNPLEWDSDENNPANVGPHAAAVRI